eukprot:1776069-Rhodomonas_salina.2
MIVHWQRSTWRSCYAGTGYPARMWAIILVSLIVLVTVTVGNSIHVVGRTLAAAGAHGAWRAH